MGIFDKAENEAENLAQKDPNLADKGLNELGQEANQMTGDRFGNQINEGVQAAESRFGQQGGNQGQGQGGYQQDPNQDPNQGQDQTRTGRSLATPRGARQHIGGRLRWYRIPARR